MRRQMGLKWVMLTMMRLTLHRKLQLDNIVTQTAQWKAQSKELVCSARPIKVAARAHISHLHRWATIKINITTARRHHKYSAVETTAAAWRRSKKLVPSITTYPIINRQANLINKIWIVVSVNRQIVSQTIFIFQSTRMVKSTDLAILHKHNENHTRTINHSVAAQASSSHLAEPASMSRTSLTSINSRAACCSWTSRSSYNSNSSRFKISNWPKEATWVSHRCLRCWSNIRMRILVMLINRTGEPTDLKGRRMLQEGLERIHTGWSSILHRRMAIMVRGRGRAAER